MEQAEGVKIKRRFWMKKRINPRGHPASQRQRDTVRARNILNNPMNNPEIVEKVRLKNLGRHTPERIKRKISISEKKTFLEGRKPTAFKKGMKLSKENIEALRIRALTNNPNNDPEVRLKKGMKLRGRIRSKEHIEHHRLAVTGKKHNLSKEERLRRTGVALSAPRNKDGTFAKRVALISLIILCLIPFTSAEQNASIQIRVVNNTIQVAGLIEVDVGGVFGMQKLPGFFIERINETMTSNPISCTNVNVLEGNVTNVYQTNCTFNILYEKELSLNFNNTQSIYTTGSDIEQRLDRCYEERGNYLGAYTACEASRAGLENVETNLTKCQSDLSSCRSEKALLQSEKTTLETEKEDNKNQKWIFLFLGVGLGAVGTLAYSGKIGVIRVKRPEDEYNTKVAR